MGSDARPVGAGVVALIWATPSLVTGSGSVGTGGCRSPAAKATTPRCRCGRSPLSAIRRRNFVDEPNELGSDWFAGLGAAWNWTIARPQLSALMTPTMWSR